jgi:hypothetical protein
MNWDFSIFKMCFVDFPHLALELSPIIFIFKKKFDFFSKKPNFENVMHFAKSVVHNIWDLS